ncbi:MAG: pyridoxamine 5'-phosphate oxidase family protein [Acidovorax sp.]|nr:pyridoxamine 5'-phosphate oxidase family protein [Acidovorax sp.]
MVLKDFLEAQRFFFIASASAAGDCDCSYRGRKAPPQDEPEPLLIVCAGGEVVFPDYPGNHLMNTLGNLLQQPEVALLFVDFSREARSVLLQGQAEVQGMDGVDAALRARWPTAPRVVRLRVSRLREQRVDGLPVLQFARM